MVKPLLSIERLRKSFAERGFLRKTNRAVHAVNDVTLTIRPRETYGLVGESGSGKTTVGRLMIRLLEPTDGTVTFDGENVTEMNAKEIRALRRQMQMVFQDPYSSLNPRMRIEEILEEPLRIQGVTSKKEMRQRVEDMMRTIGLSAADLQKMPHAFSGGQCQRIALARALINRPRLIICDEAVSALDVSIQSQILNLLMELQEQFDLSYLFITHDLRVVRHISDRIGVLYLGRIMEEAPTDVLFERPVHPYTLALLSAVPRFDDEQQQEQAVIRGEIPSPYHLPTGCVFHPRCPHAWDRCRREVPGETQLGPDHRVRCFLAEEKKLPTD